MPATRFSFLWQQAGVKEFVMRYRHARSLGHRTIVPTSGSSSEGRTTVIGGRPREFARRDGRGIDAYKPIAGPGTGFGASSKTSCSDALRACKRIAFTRTLLIAPILQ